MPEALVESYDPSLQQAIALYRQSVNVRVLLSSLSLERHRPPPHRRHCHAGRAGGLCGQVSEPAKRRVPEAGRRRSDATGAGRRVPCAVPALGARAQKHVYVPLFR